MPTKQKDDTAAEKEFEAQLEAAKNFMTPMIMTYMKNVRKALIARGWACSEIYDDAGDEDYEWAFAATSPTKVEHNFKLSMMDARHWDGTFGTNFQLSGDCKLPTADDDAEWDVYLDCCLYNFTNKVWVDVASRTAVEGRFRELVYKVIPIDKLVSIMEAAPDDNNN